MSNLKVFKSVQDFIKYRESMMRDQTVGLVPTMGALHTGHSSLIEKSRSENSITVVSIYVNPTQFNNPEDFKKYPQTWQGDLTLAEKAGAQVVISPTYEDIYPDQYKYKITENDFSKVLCGAHRPGHFDGVLTVVMKLIQMTQADCAYFGEKDYQQLQLISDMAKAFFLKTKIAGCPTKREEDGLAMSSRNLRLTEAGRKKAPALYKALSDFNSVQQAREFLEKENIEVEYLEEHFGRRFVAAFIDNVRLIDNVRC